MQKLLISTLLLAAVAADNDCTLKCPDDYLSFIRSPTANNLQTSLWCVKPIFVADPVNVTGGEDLCASEKAVLTTYENDGERQQILAALKSQLTSLGKTIGSILVDGHRTAACDVADRSVLNSAACKDPLKAFEIDDKHTDPTFMLQHWADTEPSGTFYNKEVESCLQLSISAFASRSGGANDFLCDYAKQPSNVDSVEFWNFGALCGKLPHFE